MGEYKNTKNIFIYDESENKKLTDYSKINLQNDYTHIRGYYGCCTKDLDSYYKKGIIPIEKDFAIQQAIKLLSNERITEDKIISVFNDHWAKLDKTQRFVWLSLTRDELINYSGHYLIYGSEFICGMAAELFCQSDLKGKGIPTIFYCDIPIEKIHNNYIDGINEKIQHGCGNNCGFKILGNVLPNEIVKHEHPGEISNPLDGWLPYYNK